VNTYWKAASTAAIYHTRRRNSPLVSTELVLKRSQRFEESGCDRDVPATRVDVFSYRGWRWDFLRRKWGLLALSLVIMRLDNGLSVTLLASRFGVSGSYSRPDGART
jgi:hypothetical protein